MISKQASTLPRRLLRRYGTSVPFELADCLGITILECHDFKLQKGAFKVILNNCFIFINANLSTEMKKLVCAHELGHALLHRPLGKTDTGLMEFELFDITNTTEYEANLFAANLLLDEEEVARQLCPQCREAAERARCPVCGRETGEMVREENPTFDWARFQALKEGACD